MLPTIVLPQPLYRKRWPAELLRALIKQAFRAGPVQRFVERMYGIVVILGKPQSRGRLTLRAADPDAPADIDPAYFSAPADLTTLVAAVRLARRIVRDRAIDCVVTTSAYESNHLVGLALGDRRPAWLADFRDGWTFHPWKPEFPTTAQRRLDRWLERRVVQTADRVVVVERPVGDDFRDRLGIDSAYIPNGWDPELEAEAASAPPPAIDPDRFTLVHTGKLSGGWGRHPGPLFEAMARLRSADPNEAARLELVLAGRRDSEEQRLIEGLELGGMVRHLGELPRAEALALQRHADALLLLTSRTLVWELPGKVFEYMGARRPVLALAADNEAARVVEEAGIGWTVPPDDVDAILAALRGMLRGELADAYAPRDLDRFVYPAPAEALAAEIERAVAARALTRRA